MKPSLGYTLLEILLTLSIIAVLMTFSFPSLYKSFNHQRIEILTQKIIQELYLARSEAILRRENIRYCSQVKGEKWNQDRLIIDSKGKIVHSFEKLPDGYSLIFRNSLNVVHEVTFTPLGFTHAQNGSFYLSSSNETIRIIVTISGKIRFEASTELPPLPLCGRGGLESEIKYSQRNHQDDPVDF